MRTRSSTEHDAAVARRLELLTAELAGVREWGVPEPEEEPAPAPVTVALDSWGPVTGSEPPGAPAPSLARLPGRHASRRGPVGRWEGLVPEGLAGRVALGPGQLAVVAVVAVAGLVLTCWWLLRSDAHPLPAPAAAGVGAPALATPQAVTASSPVVVGGSGASSAAPTTGTVVVDVSGKVRRPGIAVLRPGARVVDALRAAGGARPGVDLSNLNLARVVSDGEQIVVGGPAPPSGVAPAVPAASGAPPGLVDINTADETTLETLPEVGPVTAAAIMTYRTQHGGFTSVDQLLDVDGIGDATLTKLKPYVTV